MIHHQYRKVSSNMSFNWCSSETAHKTLKCPLGNCTNPFWSCYSSGTHSLQFREILDKGIKKRIVSVVLSLECSGSEHILDFTLFKTIWALLTPKSKKVSRTLLAHSVRTQENILCLFFKLIFQECPYT